MNKEIKEHIAAINSGIIPEGYKKTKVGIVPVEWKVEHIGKHLQEYREISNDIEKYPVYSSSRKGLIPQSDYYDQKEATQTNLGYKIVPVGYVTYRHMSDDDIFHFNLNTTGQSVLVSSEYPVFNAKSNANLYYIISCLNEMSRFRYFCRSQKLGGTRTRLYYKNLSMYQLPFPPLPEQQKIAEILSTQDKLIELQEKKIEQLKELKKAYLQKMFPQKGSKYPELRFKGFTEEWEQRKLEELTERIIVGLATSVTPYYREKGVPLLRNMNIKENYLDDNDILYLDEDYANSNVSKMIHKDDVLTVHTGANIGTTCIAPKEYEGSLSFTTLITTPTKTKLDSLFLMQYMNSVIGKKKIESIITAGGKPNLNSGDLGKFLVSFPKSIEEQRIISNLFSNLDYTITLHQRKSEQEKQKKKALMQLLLTGIVRMK